MLENTKQQFYSRIIIMAKFLVIRVNARSIRSIIFLHLWNIGFKACFKIASGFEDVWRVQTFRNGHMCLSVAGGACCEDFFGGEV